MNITIEGFTPYSKQQDWISKIENPEVKYAVMCVGRQVGKSLIAENLLLKWALENNNATLMLVAPIYSQVRRIFDDLDKVLSATPLLVSKNKANYEMVFVNGSKIYFRSAERPDGLRGFTLTHLIIDEAAFIRDEVWDTILKPTILVKGQKVLFTSTPRSKNFFYTLYLRGLDDDQPQYVSIKGSTYDNPYISSDELDEARKTLPDNIFRQEILAEFIDNGGEVFADIDRFCILNQYPPKTNTKYYAGIDFGRLQDYTVLTILDENGTMVASYRDRQKPWNEITENIIKMLNEWKPSTYIEVNSIGDVLYEQIRAKYQNIFPFVTTLSSKKEIIESLIYSFNNNQITLPSPNLNPPLYSELKTFTYKYSPKTRNISYGGAEGTNDDTVMSLALANEALRQKKSVATYALY